MDKVEKKEGTETTCMTCGLKLVCRQFEFQGKPTLSWCDDGTTNKHYGLEGESPVCNYSNILKKFETLNRIENFIESRMGDRFDTETKQRYIQLLFSRV